MTTTPDGELVLDAFPELADGEGTGGALTGALPVLGSLGSVVVFATMGSSAPGGQARSLLAAGVFVLTTVGVALVQLDRQRQRRLQAVRRGRVDYLRHLDGVRTTVRDAASRQRDALLREHPPPESLPLLAEDGSRLWQRTPGHPAYLQVRYAVHDLPLWLALVVPDATERSDPAAVSAARRLLATHRVQPDLPATLDLRALDRVELCGPAPQARSLARALVCSASALHSPSDLAVAVLASDDSVDEWDWVKWLPHAGSDEAEDAVGPRRMVSTRVADLADLVPSDRHLLVVVDDGADRAGVTRVAAQKRPRTTLLDVRTSCGQHSDDRGLCLHLDALARADRCDPATAEALARRLARHAAAKPAFDLPELLGLDDIGQYDPSTVWQEPPPGGLLRVPIGVDDDGEPVQLDLKELAEQGMGPHGLVIGATGSGKSELLRTLVLGLTMTHSPELLNLVLVDFKGGATFAGMSTLPHVSAMITNLEEQLTLVDRMHDALAGELVRRQELLRDAGGFGSARDHARARADGSDLDPLPTLLVVVDEFSEMLSARPELIELFVAIGRLGRSLGVHLLLASQRLEEGRLRGLDSHLSYRIGLRTFSAQESRAVLGVPDAHHLPPVPGLGYLKPDESHLVRFTTAFVSGPRVRPRRHDQVLPFTVAEVRPDPREPATSPSEPVLDEAVRVMSGHGPAARRIWLPPLDVPDTLDALLTSRPPLTAPLGSLDRPRQQCREVLTVDLTGPGGHVAVVGAPLSGKTTLLRSLVVGLALTTTPREMQVFVLDLAAGGWDALRGLPHLAGLGTRAEPDVVRRTVAEVTGILDRREAYFRSHDIDSVHTYRSRRDQREVDDGYGDVILVVDGWAALRTDFDDLEPDLQQIAARGLALGVHLLTASGRWADFRAALRDLLGTRLELRLGDPADSELDRRAAAQVPIGRPGRGITEGGLHFLAALPRIDADPDPATLADGLASLVDHVAATWPGPPGPKLRLLPELLPASELLAHAPPHRPRLLLLGVDEAALAPVGLDPDADPHWLVLGDGGSGKSAALRAYLREVVRTRTPSEAQVVVVDYRRSLLGEVGRDHLLHYLCSATEATPALAELASYLLGRLPGPDVTAEQLRGRSWWTGAEVHVVVDDYDLVATGQGSPVQALQPLLAQARDVGLHLVVARRSGGASRALYEPVVQTLRDLAAPGLVLSGSPDEGPLVGNVRPQPGPPGRGRLVTRSRGTDVVQVAWHEPATPPSATTASG